MNPNSMIIEPYLVSYQEDGGEFTPEIPSADSYTIFTLGFSYVGHIPNGTKWTARFIEYQWGPADTNNRAEVEFVMDAENKIVEYSFSDLLGLDLDLEDLIEIFPDLSDFNKLLTDILTGE
jgi:hypothetical protein